MASTVEDRAIKKMAVNDFITASGVIVTDNSRVGSLVQSGRLRELAREGFFLAFSRLLRKFVKLNHPSVEMAS